MPVEPSVTQSVSGAATGTERPMSVSMSEFARFLATDLGQAVLAHEEQLIDKHLPGLVGYNLLQLSVQKAKRLSSAARVGHYIKLGFAPALEGEEQDSIWADYQTFPIATDCIDIALLHHVLEFSSEPHQLLREADRTLTAGGHMLIVGFNPVSSWPLFKQYLQWGKGLPMAASAIRQGRLSDWLSVLNYDVLHQQSYFFRPPVNSTRILSRLAGLERIGERCHLPFGLYYMVLARKRSYPVNVIRPYWPRGIKTARRAPVHTTAINKVLQKSQGMDC